MLLLAYTWYYLSRNNAVILMILQKNSITRKIKNRKYKKMEKTGRGWKIEVEKNITFLKSVTRCFIPEFFGWKTKSLAILILIFGMSFWLNVQRRADIREVQCSMNIIAYIPESVLQCTNREQYEKHWTKSHKIHSKYTKNN